MDIRYSASPNDVKRYTTEELRREFLITDLYVADTVKATYSHVDRMVILGIMPVQEKVSIDKGIDIWANFGTSYFLERREAGVFNLGGSGSITADGVRYAMNYEDCLYISKGVKEVFFESDDPEKPAKFYLASTPAHRECTTTLLTFEKANHRPTGDVKTANKRVINQFIHPDVLETCQLSMGLTQLDEGSVWNTMPSHTHERRMEVYTYFEIPEGEAVIHLMGQPKETRHLVMKNFDAVISPSWSIHSGCGTANYTFIWAMGGENQAFDDMDNLAPTDLE
ncbi:MAG: 5-dehydro-4-deoxy-D-glucuronate isomerase [Solobacterium sp.]|nr:5-dehydro-4-deoxy-D-glucuronate isomerase [Solobacterium sp.]